jgi:predicted phosphodiesterase
VTGDAVRRVGAIGDIHCEDAALERALAMFAERGVDRVLAVGDILDGRGDADRCCRLLRDAGALVVRGNHERWFLRGEMRSLPDATLSVSGETRAFLEALAPTTEIDTSAGRLLLCHGVGDDDMAALRPDTSGYALQSIYDVLRPLLVRPDLRFVVGGHTHQRMVRRFEGLTFINAGTLHRDWEPGVALIDFAARTVEHHSIGTAVTLDDIVPLD